MYTSRYAVSCCVRALGWKSEYITVALERSEAALAAAKDALDDSFGGPAPARHIAMNRIEMAVQSPNVRFPF